MADYRAIFGEIHKERQDYFFQWYFDRPMVITKERDRELLRLQQLLYKCVQYYGAHYREYMNVIPYGDRVCRILELQEEKEYRPGTFRPDYIIQKDGQIKVCEITSRFFGNGYFLSYFSDVKGNELASQYGFEEHHGYVEEMLSYFVSLVGDSKKIVILTSADKSDSIPLYGPFYSKIGKDVLILKAEEITAHIKELKNSFIFSALNQKDLLALPEEVIRIMIDRGCVNDFRSVFLAHDKRFFSLFFDDGFTGCFLSEDETVFLRKHTIETYIYGHAHEIWNDARTSKDKYILKHRCLGKSEKVYAGSMTELSQWEELWSSNAVEDMILQPFIRQRVFPNEWGGTIIDEYISGTILCADQEYFGTGLFRTCSKPVLQYHGDDRKVGMYYLRDETEMPYGSYILL